jgi:hypothetical protein
VVVVSPLVLSRPLSPLWTWVDLMGQNACTTIDHSHLVSCNLYTTITIMTAPYAVNLVIAEHHKTGNVMVLGQMLTSSHT